MTLALNDDEMPDATGVGAVTTPPPSRRGKKTGSYAEVGSVDDDEADAASVSGGGGSNKRGGGQAKSATRTNGTQSAANRSAKENSEDSDGEEDGGAGSDEDGEEEEYEVQEIIGHMVDDRGNPRFRVIWKGYEDPSDYTWEPEENLAENASEILSDYIFKIGGHEKLRAKPAKGKKRGRQSTSTAAATTTKRSRKSDVHPADRELPAEAQKAFKPPAGSWEDDVVDVEMFRADNGELRVFLTWKNGSKSQHSASQTYIRCPQKILRFYESRISFKTATE